MRYQITGFCGHWTWFRARYLAHVTQFQDGVQNPIWLLTSTHIAAVDTIIMRKWIHSFCSLLAEFTTVNLMSSYDLVEHLHRQRDVHGRLALLTPAHPAHPACSFAAAFDKLSASTRSFGNGCPDRFPRLGYPFPSISSWTWKFMLCQHTGSPDASLVHCPVCVLQKCILSSWNLVYNLTLLWEELHTCTG